jgi:hypothetical protein
LKLFPGPSEIVERASRVRMNVIAAAAGEIDQYPARLSPTATPLRARPPANLTAELMLDVGIWSNLVISIFKV